MSRILFAATILISASSFAYAGTTTKFVKVETGLYDDPMDGFNTYAMRVTADTDWTNADLSISLHNGILKHAPPAFLGNPNVVNILGDTAGHAPTLVVGDLFSGFKGIAGYASHTESSIFLDTSWFTTETDDIGTFDIAMITISPDADGEIRWRTISGVLVEEGGYTDGAKPNWVIRDGAIVPVPEPGSLVLIGIGLVSLLGTRRRS